MRKNWANYLYNIQAYGPLPFVESVVSFCETISPGFIPQLQFSRHIQLHENHFCCPRCSSGTRLSSNFWRYGCIGRGGGGAQRPILRAIYWAWKDGCAQRIKVTSYSDNRSCIFRINICKDNMIAGPYTRLCNSFSGRCRLLQVSLTLFYTRDLGLVVFYVIVLPT